MTKTHQVPGGDDQNPGGTSEHNQEQQTQPTTDETPKPRTVAYESYQKAIDEAKKAKAKAAEYERAQRAREEEELKKQGEYKKLLEQRESELNEARTARQALESKISDSRKLNAFLGSVTGDVPKQYWSLIDLDTIAVDPETGMPDEASVKKAAADFEKQYSDVVKKPTKGKLPNDAPQGSGAAVGFEAEIRKAKNQKEFDAVLVKYGKA
jgi:hypothetical protein